MSQNEHALVAQLAQIASDLAIENRFYKKQFGEVLATGHPDYITLKARFEPLLSQLQGTDSEHTLAALLKELKTI